MSGLVSFAGRGVVVTSKAICRVTLNYEGLLNTARSLRGFCRFTAELSSYPRFASVKKVASLIKPYEVVINSGVNFLTFFELPLRITRLSDCIQAWNRNDMQTVYKTISTGIQVLQKSLESFLIIPNTWGWINGHKLFAQVSAKTGLAISFSYVVIAKELCVLSSSFFNRKYASGENDKQAAFIRKKEMALLGGYNIQIPGNIPETNQTNKTEKGKDKAEEKGDEDDVGGTKPVNHIAVPGLLNIRQYIDTGIQSRNKVDIENVLKAFKIYVSNEARKQRCKDPSKKIDYRDQYLRSLKSKLEPKDIDNAKWKYINKALLTFSLAALDLSNEKSTEIDKNDNDKDTSMTQENLKEKESLKAWIRKYFHSSSRETKEIDKADGEDKVELNEVKFIINKFNQLQSDSNTNTGVPLLILKEIVNYKISKCKAQIKNAKLLTREYKFAKWFDISKMAIVTLGLSSTACVTYMALARFADAVGVAATITGLIVSGLGFARNMNKSFSKKEDLPRRDYLQLYNGA